MVQVIVERMMSYLRSTTDEHIKKDIVRKVRGVSVSELAEYTPATLVLFPVTPCNCHAGLGAG